MSKQNDGGAAFPTIARENDGQGNYCYYSEGGMTLRDWFAGQALAGLVADSSYDPKDKYNEYASRFCYTIADAMLAERERSNGQEAR